MENDAPTVMNRKNAGILLAGKVAQLDLSNAIVVGVPHGGVCVAAELANQLHLPLDVMMCRKIKDPADQTRTIGSVSANNVIMHNCSRTIPQDYLYFQSIHLRNEIKHENDFYYGSQSQPELEYKTVILADDILLSADTLLACILEIKKLRALKIIAAVPFVETEAARIIRNEVDDLIFLKIQQHIHSSKEYYQEFPEVKEWEVRDLLRQNKKDFIDITA